MAAQTRQVNGNSNCILSNKTTLTSVFHTGGRVDITSTSKAHHSLALIFIVIVIVIVYETCMQNWRQTAVEETITKLTGRHLGDLGSRSGCTVIIGAIFSKRQFRRYVNNSEETAKNSDVDSKQKKLNNRKKWYDPHGKRLGFVGQSHQKIPMLCPPHFIKSFRRDRE